MEDAITELEMEDTLFEKKPNVVDAVTNKMKNDGKDVDTLQLNANTNEQIANAVKLPKKHSKKKRKAPPPPTKLLSNVADLPSRAEIAQSGKPHVESTQKGVAPAPLERDNQQDRIGNGDKKEYFEPAEIKCSGSELSLDNPFHPLYEQQVHQLPRPMSKTSINDSCSDLSLDNPFYPLYDDYSIGAKSVTETVSDLSLTNPFHPQYEEFIQQKEANKTINADKSAVANVDADHGDKVATQKNKLADRVKGFFLSLIPCIRSKEA